MPLIFCPDSDVKPEVLLSWLTTVFRWEMKEKPWLRLPTHVRLKLGEQMKDPFLKWLAEDDLKRMQAEDLMLEEDHIRLCLFLEDSDSTYKSYLSYRLKVLREHLAKRRCFQAKGGPTPPKIVLANPLEEIKTRLTIEDVLDRYVAVVPRGNRLVFCCPAHGDTHPSGVVYPDQRRYWCFGCQRGGDIFEAVQHFQGLCFREAVEALAKVAGVNLGQGSRWPTILR